MSDTTHSPLPMPLKRLNLGRTIVITDANGDGLIELRTKDQHAEAVAALVLESVNGYAALQGECDSLRAVATAATNMAAKFDAECEALREALRELVEASGEGWHDGLTPDQARRYDDAHNGARALLAKPDGR